MRVTQRVKQEAGSSAGDAIEGDSRVCVMSQELTPIPDQFPFRAHALSLSFYDRRMMRLPTLERDYWQLRSGEEAHRKRPKDFWIPPLEQRQNLTRGQAAKLMFDIESTDDAGKIHLEGERMWGIVAERCG